MSDGQRNTKPVDDNYQADLDDVGFWLRVALLQPPQMSYGGVSVKTIPTEQIKAMLRTLDQQATLEAERDAARAAVERLREACEGVPGWLDDASDKLNTDMPWQYACYDAPWRYGEDDPLAIIRAKAAAIRAALGEDVQP